MAVHMSKRNNQNLNRHPLVFSFCGYSNAGKSTLISKVTQKMSSDYRIGFIKSDAHCFDMDKKGKDTHTIRDSGASEVMVFDPENWATIGKRDKVLNNADIYVDCIYDYLQNSAFDFCDLIFVEGRKQSSLPKFVILDGQNKILSRVQSKEITNILAYIGEKPSSSISLDRPYFCRDQVDDIVNFLYGSIKSVLEKRPLYGLVLTGGFSRRMQQDKALLNYHGQPQAMVTWNLLSKYCERSFISSRSGQWDGSNLESFPKIEDRFLEFGPIGGILSAMKKYPEVAWLVLACDLPFFTAASLETLIKKRAPLQMATAFCNSEGLTEPLCAIYEPRSFKRLIQYLGSGVHCPRKILQNSPTRLVSSDIPNELRNVNNLDELEKVKKELLEKIPIRFRNSGEAIGRKARR